MFLWLMAMKLIRFVLSYISNNNIMLELFWVLCLLICNNNYNDLYENEIYCYPDPWPILISYIFFLFLNSSLIFRMKCQEKIFKNCIFKHKVNVSPHIELYEWAIKRQNIICQVDEGSFRYRKLISKRIGPRKPTQFHIFLFWIAISCVKEMYKASVNQININLSG